MIKRYYSNYTGQQIDEAVKAIIENGIQLEDFSPELIAEIKKWIAESGSGASKEELVFKSHYDFPAVGETDKLYIATDEDKIYYWNGRHYVALVSEPELPEITEINGGGAQ